MRVLIATGSSGGHIFPALSLFEALKSKDAKIELRLVLPQRAKLSYALFPDFKEIRYISTAPLKLKADTQNLFALFRFLKGALQSLNILLEFNPDVVVGFGTLDCLAIIFFSWLFRIKTLIHEQNVLPGRANMFLSRFCDKIAVSFPETKKYFNVSPEKIVHTGNPLRRELQGIDRQSALRFFGLNEGLFTILVMGGSQGSASINRIIPQALSMLEAHAHLQVIHLTGQKDYDKTMNFYSGLKITVSLSTFLEKMHYAYSASDIAVSRAGATTIAELMHFRVPSILIPYPFAYKHQSLNATVLKEHNAAVIIEEERLKPENFKETLESFINNPNKLQQMRQALDGLYLEGAATRLVNEVLG
ncbi:MAG: undecaprenyldiphospho-muramoylpentapeptide beta-N-acetylglucosaminyltransferase [Candidatus Omnitrophota bacterium]